MLAAVSLASREDALGLMGQGKSVLGIVNKPYYTFPSYITQVGEIVFHLARCGLLEEMVLLDV